MKKLLFIFFFVSSTNLFAQYIENIELLNNSTPPSLHIFGAYGSTGVSITSITHEVSDTFKINLFFKSCPGLTVIVPFDTILQFNDNWPAAPTHIQALSILDTTTDTNCGPITVFDTLFVYNATWPSLNVANQNVIPELKIYPNPTQDFMTIENTFADQILALSLIDYSGKLIKRFDPKKNTLQLTDYSPGIYLLQISTIEGYYYEKIILE
jgi:hypothetical protein